MNSLLRGQFFLLISPFRLGPVNIRPHMRRRNPRDDLLFYLLATTTLDPNAIALIEELEQKIAPGSVVEILD